MNILHYHNRIVMCIAALILLVVECHAGSDYVTITLPEKVIRQSFQSILPLDINPQDDLLQGKLVLDSIDQLKLGENSARVRGVILGKNLVLKTRFGNQDIRLKVGEVQFSLICDFSFRFAPKEKKLYITPHIVDPDKGKTSNQVNKVLPVLALLDNKEYPVPLSHLQTMKTKIGKRSFSLEMEPVDIQISASQLVLKMAPKVNKIN